MRSSKGSASNPCRSTGYTWSSVARRTPPHSRAHHTAFDPGPMSARALRKLPHCALRQRRTSSFGSTVFKSATPASVTCVLGRYYRLRSLSANAPHAHNNQQHSGHQRCVARIHTGVWLRGDDDGRSSVRRTAKRVRPTRPGDCRHCLGRLPPQQAHDGSHDGCQSRPSCHVSSLRDQVPRRPRAKAVGPQRCQGRSCYHGPKARPAGTVS